ncbi:hypothetical protein KTD26_22960 [Burkholderia multivorans]|uniref:hypothetical protein n=2 Tax=Burkholderia multivorans TaxID=87883 RepID=UPI001C221091|nr:hypothetical protein [Burkholderia multivorans]MBU9145385.1 hypothetical protein [Burkholderia multivorans]MBU9540306.1 hypothetical protein [Burkholderia multivorans]HEF4770813.1 hypothetical protein [Burkholderia multivorans]
MTSTVIPEQRVNPFVDMTSAQRADLTIRILDVFKRLDRAMTSEEVCTSYFPDMAGVAAQHIDKLARGGLLRRQPRPHDLRFVYWLAGSDAAPPLPIPCKQADGTYSTGADDSFRPRRAAHAEAVTGSMHTRPAFHPIVTRDGRNHVSVSFPHLYPLEITPDTLQDSAAHALRYLRLFRQSIDLEVARLEFLIQRRRCA